MTVVITGHRGFIGGRLHTKLIETNQDFIAYDVEDGASFPYLKDVDGIDTIYHIGAMSGIPLCEEFKNSALDLNVVHTQKWAQIALEKDARLVFTSSAAAARITPTWYGITKKMAENILLHYHHAHGLKVTIFRLPNIYGPGSLYKDSVIARMCKDAILKKKVNIHGDGSQSRIFLYVDDIVNLFLNYEREGLFRIANGRINTIKYIAKEIAETFNAQIVETEMREVENPVNSYKDTPKDISIDLKINFEEGLKNTINYFKKEVNALR